MSTPAKPVAEQVVEPRLIMVMSILPDSSSGAASLASMARSSVLQNVTLPPVFVAPFAAASALVSSPEPDFALPASEPPEPELPSDFEPPSEDEEDEAEEPLEDESFPELSLPQAVSERVAATPMAARAVIRVYFTVFPQNERCACGRKYLYPAPSHRRPFAASSFCHRRIDLMVRPAQTRTAPAHRPVPGRAPGQPARRRSSTHATLRQPHLQMRPLRLRRLPPVPLTHQLVLHAFQLGAYYHDVLVFLAVLDVTGRAVWGAGCREGAVRAAGDRRRGGRRPGSTATLRALDSAGQVAGLAAADVVRLMSHGRPAARERGCTAGFETTSVPRPRRQGQQPSDRARTCIESAW